MLAKDLIDQLEQRGLLDQEIIEALREQLDQGGTRVTPEAVAKLLVDNGQLTRFQATKLIGELRSDEYEGVAEVAEVVEDDLIEGFEEVEAIEVEAEAVEAIAVEAVPVEAVAVEAVAVDAVPVEAVGTGSIMDDGMGEAGDSPRPSSRRPRGDETKSTWDSFKIYGYVGIILLLLLTGGGLYFALSRGSADDYIDIANKLYNEQNYTNAQERYVDFLAMFGEENQYSSLAKVRVTMTELYRAADMSDPTRALKLAQEKLPAIENEMGLDEERGNLAALLVDIADNIAKAAVDEPETEKKKLLLESLGESIALTENANYVTSSTRAMLAGRLANVEESRKRVQRDIDRNLRLDATVKSMDTLLKEKKTREAYDERFALLRDFPELEDNDRIVELVTSASEIQQTLVSASDKRPEIVDGEPNTESLRNIVLTANQGRDIPSLRGENLFLRAGGSVLAFAADTGKLLWRSFVGYGQDHSPARIEGGEGVLLSESTKLEIQRRNGKDGAIEWRAKIGEPFSEPVVNEDEIYVSTFSGTLMAIDADNGKLKWSAKIPQHLEVGPGVDSRKNRIYLPGNHSNLYVLNGRDGSCESSFYLEHAEGTVAVPPIPLLGHVFVIENAGVDFSYVHVLRSSEDGSGLKRVQDSFRMTGNVKIPPIILQQRRMIVLTDRGQVSVYDVEPTAENEQVTVVAKQLASYDEPTSTEMAVGKSQMWITGTRIGRYELQINTGRVVPDWFKNEGDTFIGRPFSADEALIHARVLRGTTGIRLTAARPKTGEEIWRTDVGVPIAMIKKAEGGFHAISTQAALFKLGRESLETGSSDGPIENPGGDGVEMRFENPIKIDDNTFLLMNQSVEAKAGRQVAIYDPSRRQEKLRRVNLSLPAGRPSGGSLISGSPGDPVQQRGLFVPLDSGRAMLMRWQTGASMGSPFQPVSDPVGKVQWSQPVRLPDDPQQVVIADSRKSIYRLRVGDQMRDLATGALETPLLGPTAGIGNVMMATTAGPSADFVVGYDMNSLKQTFKKPLDGRSTWGPVAAGEFCLLRTDDSKLRGFSDDGSQTFEFDLPRGKPVGEPIQAGKVMVLAGAPGWIVAFDPTTGQLVGKTNINQPISATPLPMGNTLLVPGTEGVIYIVEVPTGA